VQRVAEAVLLTLTFNHEYVEIVIPVKELLTNLDDIKKLIGREISILKTELCKYIILSNRHISVKNKGVNKRNKNSSPVVLFQSIPVEENIRR